VGSVATDAVAHARQLPGMSAMQELVSILSFDCDQKADLMSMAVNTSRIPLSYSGHLDTVEDVIWV
jgi:hypothetical protein